jgi:hypothetical protein
MAQAQQQNYNISLNKMAAMLPTIPNDEQGQALLKQLTTHPSFGALALTEIAKRDRAKAMEGAGAGGNLRDAFLAKMAADDRFGLNNIVSQAEQGAIDFGGQEPMTAAGGGMIAFEDGGQVPRYAAGLAIQGLTRAAPYAGRAVGRGIAALRNRPLLYGSAIATPFGFLGGEEGPEGPPVSDTYPEEFERGARTEADFAEAAAIRKQAEEVASGKKSEKSAAEGIASILGGNTTASDILKERRRLEKEAGLGEYGADVKDKQAKRRTESEEKFGKEKIVQALLGAAEAAGAGGKRLTGLGALAAAATGGGKGALGVMKAEREALDKLADAEEKMALAEDLYKRGDIASAQKMAAEAQQQRSENTIKLRQLQIQERALAARSTGKVAVPQTILAQLQKEAASIEDAFSAGQIDEAEYARRMNSLQLRQREALAMSVLAGLERGERETEG